ncbi:CE295 protein, partial [Tichodroma muraria]|nr:CE295 protein [Tichodroma muraria]
QEREFLPLAADADYSAFIRPDSSPKAQSPNKSHCPSHQTAGNYVVLQYSEVESIFLALKSSTKYASHLENLELLLLWQVHPAVQAWSVVPLTEICLASFFSLGRNGALANQLKKVGEVKVSSAEDRKSGEIEMYQRTSRLYNQLTEVKIRNEEKTRQETYAKNREKAKEFQKKMLEKLRAKKTWK